MDQNGGQITFVVSCFFCEGVLCNEFVTTVFLESGRKRGDPGRAWQLYPPRPGERAR